MSSLSRLLGARLLPLPRNLAGAHVKIRTANGFITRVLHKYKTGCYKVRFNNCWHHALANGDGTWSIGREVD